MPLTIQDHSEVRLEAEYQREIAKEMQRMAIAACRRSKQIIRESRSAIRAARETQDKP